MIFEIGEKVKVLSPPDVTGDSEEFTTGTVHEIKWNMFRVHLANGQMRWIPGAYLERLNK